MPDDYQRISTLRNGAIVVDANSEGWGEPETDQSLYQIAVIRSPLKTIELRPGEGSVRQSVETERIVLIRPGDVEHVHQDVAPHETQRVDLAAFLFREDLLQSSFGSLQLEGLRNVIDPMAIHLLKASALLDENSDPLLVDHITMAILARVRGLGPPDQIKNSGRIDRAIAYIHERLGQKLTLDELASSAAMSSYHFLRTFREVTGLTPLAYVTARRIEQAKVMLIRAKMPLSAIAIMCGFSSQSHFSSAFKAHTGHTPREYQLSTGAKALPRPN